MKKITILISTLIFAFLSCEKQDTNDNISDTDYFPNTIDSYWKYERYDSLTNSVDTIRVSIIGDTLISSDLYNIWNYDYNNKIEKTYVRQSNDSIIIFDSQLNRIEQLYIIPLELSFGWVNPDYHFDTSFVSKTQDIVINEMTYSDAILVERNAFCCNDYLIEKIWIKPKIGLLKLESKHLILGPYKNETWKLLENGIQ